MKPSRGSDLVVVVDVQKDVIHAVELEVEVDDVTGGGSTEGAAGPCITVLVCEAGHVCTGGSRDDGGTDGCD